MMLGLITTKDVLRHAPMIARGFGAAAFLRCCLVIVRRRRTTFLECIFPAPKPSRLQASAQGPSRPVRVRPAR